jgi:hypothetical protein
MFECDDASGRSSGPHAADRQDNFSKHIFAH